MDFCALNYKKQGIIYQKGLTKGLIEVRWLDTAFKFRGAKMKEANFKTQEMVMASMTLHARNGRTEGRARRVRSFEITSFRLPPCKNQYLRMVSKVRSYVFSV
jgi:hypothetical protein